MKPILALFATALSCSAAILVAAQATGPANSVRILYPADKSANAGTVRLMAAAPLAAKVTATLDGKPLPLTRMTFADSWVLPGKLKATAEKVGDRAATSIWSAELHLPPGAHSVAVGGQRLQIWGAKEHAPAQVAAAYSHTRAHSPEGSLDCFRCHESGSGGSLGGVATPAMCAHCHDEASVQLIHHHVAEPLSKCAMCHDPHGASRPKLLVDDKEKLCSKCHSLGHFKG